VVDLFELMNIVDFSIISAALGVIAGVINSIFASRRAERQRQTEIETRQAQLFMQIWQQYNTAEYAMERYSAYAMQWEDFDDFLKKYVLVPPEERKPYASFVSMGRTFLGLVILLEKKLIDIEVVYELFCGDIIRWYEKFQPQFEEERARGIAQRSADAVEPLYKKLKNMREQRQPGIRFLMPWQELE